MRSIHVCAPTLIFTALASLAFSQPKAGAGDTKNDDTKKPDSSSKHSPDPAKFILLYEGKVDKESSLRYDARDQKLSARSGIKVDSGSSLIVKVRKDAIDSDTALNQLLITAQLASGGKTTQISVHGYSEIGKDSASGPSQAAVSIQTASEIAARLANLYWTARDILDKTMGVACRITLEDQPRDAALPGLDGPCSGPKDLATPATDAFNAFSEEATSLSAFFADPHNAAVVRMLSNDIFGMDSATVLSIATSLPKAVDTLVGDQAKPDARDAAAKKLVTRVWLIFRDMRMDVPKGVADVDKFWQAEAAKLVERLKENIVQGQIDLASAGAQDGDTLTITVQSNSIDGNGGTSATFDLNVLIRNYGPRFAPSASLFFVRRIGVTEADKTTRNLNPVRFSPAPGVTYGATFYNRKPFLKALAPGIGANLTFMNFDDPDFNLSTGKFTSTTAVDVQIGAGVQVSLFNNLLQATYGWNLNAPQKREYWGLGFGFLDVAKYFTSKFGK
jgi:hypothetical protein